MKNYIFFLFITILLLSCNPSKTKPTVKEEKTKPETTAIVSKEKFVSKTIDAKFRSIAGTPKEVMEKYYPFKVEAGSEGNERMDISTKELDAQNTQVTMIHDNMMDDSQRGIKVVMQMRKRGDAWEVISIQENYKCWKGRGHEDWGIEKCN